MKPLPIFKTLYPSRMLVVLVAFASVLVPGLSAQGQGTVNFSGGMTAFVINGSPGQPVAWSNNVQAALYWAPVGSSNFLQTGAAVRVPSSLQLPAGAFAGGTRAAGTTPGGSPAWFQVRAWAGTNYATYEEAAGHPGVLLGQSAAVQVATGNPYGDPPTPPGSLVAGGLQSFSLVAAPRLFAFRTTTNTVCVWWAVSDVAWQLQSTTNRLSSSSTWSNCAHKTNGANCVYVESGPSGTKFYRLKKP